MSPVCFSSSTACWRSQPLLMGGTRGRPGGASGRTTRTTAPIMLRSGCTSMASPSHAAIVQEITLTRASKPCVPSSPCQFDHKITAGAIRRAMERRRPAHRPGCSSRAASRVSTRLAAARRHGRQRTPHRGFDRPLVRRIHACAARRQMEHRAAAVARIGRPPKQALTEKPLQNARQRAGMQVEHGRQPSGGDAREQTDHTENQPLRAGDADFRAHALGRRLKRVDRRPLSSPSCSSVRPPARWPPTRWPQTIVPHALPRSTRKN